MRILVDADACPIVIKDILFRAAKRVGVPLILVANQPMRHPKSEWIKFVQVPGGLNEADKRILQMLRPGDLIVTGDIPLASHAVNLGGLALGVRGEVFNQDNIVERLEIRNMVEQIRVTHDENFGPRPMSDRDRREFANQLDRILTRYQNQIRRSSSADPGSRPG